MRIEMLRSASRRRQSKAGLFIAELLVYGTLLMIISGLALSAFYRALSSSTQLHRSGANLVRLLKAAEQWRADVRTGSGAPSLKLEEGWQVLEIPHGDSIISYLARSNQVWRRSGLGTPQLLVTNASASVFKMDQRQYVQAWRWEIQLLPEQKKGRTRPDFIFLAAPPQNNLP